MSMVCTFVSRPALRMVVYALLVLSLAACGLNGGSGDNETIPEPTIPPLRTPTATPIVPTPTLQPEIIALMQPAPVTDLPDSLFFTSGDVLWSLTPGRDPIAVLDADLIGPWAQTVDATRAAVTVYSTEGGSSSEAVILVDPLGGQSAPIWGPVAQPGSPGNPRIIEVRWSWYGDVLLLLREDRTVLALDPNQDADQQPRTEPLVALPGGASDLQSLPSGAGWSYLVDGQLQVLPISNEPMTPEAPFSSDVDTYRWLPGTARVLAVPASAGASGPRGSILAADARGTSIDLLLSAGQFGPSAQVALLAAAPDGQRLAFIVVAPDDRGHIRFASLWSLHLTSGRLQQLRVESGYRVTDLWWTTEGIVWRGVDRAASALQGELVYAGIEPFVLGLADPMTGASTIVVQSGALDKP